MFLGKYYLPHDKNSTHIQCAFTEPPTMSDVINVLEWGSNKLLRQGSIRISTEEKLIKLWEVIKDPLFLIQQDRTFVIKGYNHCAVIRIVKNEFELKGGRFSRKNRAEFLAKELGVSITELNESSEYPFVFFYKNGIRYLVMNKGISGEDPPFLIERLK